MIKEELDSLFNEQKSLIAGYKEIVKIQLDKISELEKTIEKYKTIIEELDALMLYHRNPPH